MLGGGRAERISAFKRLDWDPPELIVPRRNVLVVRERVSPYGEIVTPLAEEDVQRAARMIKKRGIKSVAVVYINSFMNPVRQLRTREILRRESPGPGHHAVARGATADAGVRAHLHDRAQCLRVGSSRICRVSPTG